MLDRQGHGGWKRLPALGLALYALFLVTIPFEHHDLLCELKTPQHCTACTASVVGADPHQTPILTTRPLADIGRAFAFVPLAEDILLPVRSTGRSPPVQVHA